MKEISIKVLGSGCPTCKTLYDEVVKVAQEIDSNLKVEYITDITKIVELGVMSSPVFVINDEIIIAGRVPDGTEIKNAILEKLNS